MIGIYKITSPSGRVYIGQSVNLKARYKDYFVYGSNIKYQVKLYRSFKKYGSERHKFEVIELCDESDLNNRERYWQDYYNSMIDGLNCKLTTSDDKSGRLSEETIRKKSESTKGDKHWCWGKNRPDASIMMKENNPMNDPKIRQLVSEKLKGRKTSEEVKQKLRMLEKRTIKLVGANNDITGECLIMSLNEISKYFNVGAELIRSRCTGVRRKKRPNAKNKALRKLPNWEFRIIHDFSKK